MHICKEYKLGGMGCRVLDDNPKTEIVKCTLTEGYGINYDDPKITVPIAVVGERPVCCKYAHQYSAICGWYGVKRCASAPNRSRAAGHDCAGAF